MYISGGALDSRLALGSAPCSAVQCMTQHVPPHPLTITIHRSKALPADLQAQYQQIGRRYNIESQKRHAREMGDLHRKIKLKTEAMNALPTPELRAEAATIDPTPFPPTRRLTTWTPPVPGFEAGKYDLPGAI